MVIAVLPDDLLGQVGKAVHVLPVAGHQHGQLIAVPGYAEVQPGEDLHNGLGGHGDAQHAVDAAGRGTDDLLGPVLAGGAVKAGGGDVAAAQLLNQVQCAVHAQLGAVLIHAFFIAGAGVAVLAQGAAGFAHAVTGEGGALKQQLVGALGDLAVQAAHDAGQSHRLLGVADDQVVGGQLELLLVQRGDGLALLGAAHHNAAVGHGRQVKGVHGLADLQQHVVGDVHHVADAAQAHQRQMLLHPAGAFAGAQVAHVVGQIPGA